MLSGGGEKEMEEEAECRAGWKDLPVELLLRIVSLVDDQRMVIVTSAVCTGWRDALGFGLTSLSLSWCKKNMNSLVQSLIPKFINLQVFSLRQSTPQLEDSGIETLANYCHDMKELDLSKSLRLTDKALYALGRGCPHLMKLNISGCSAFSDVALAYLSSCCRNLNILNLCGCLRAATDGALQAISCHCRGLQSLNLGWCENVSDRGVTSLAASCHDLRELDLCGCVLITDESVIALANSCPHLRSLDLYYCQNITDKAMYSLAESCMKKQSRFLKGKDFSSKNEGLMNLNISQCTALTAPAVQAVCNSFPVLHTCPEKHSLNISGCLNLTSVHCASILHAHRVCKTVVPKKRSLGEA
ncbi:F-box protein SKP2A-like [Canna indica]|uniref:F-box protein SKP2A-like n=1 Tax=Canna indica TaxID=4628 RepID=A0AAQ3KVA0_9LILI|nr:F-box protein SKP2A-like [Canna indica]